MPSFVTSSTDFDPKPKTWTWRDYSICYQSYGQSGPAIVLVHGFGASWGHWRKNLPVLGQNCRCYAIDLIGFGGSAKPIPGVEIDYTFDTWSQQIADFCREVVKSPAFLVGNSIGCIAAMQTAVDNVDLAEGVAILNCSLRLFHDRKRLTLPWYQRYGVPVVQKIFSNKAIGNLFFKQIARPKQLRKILLEAYHRPEAVSDELIEILLKPARDVGAVDVFLSFIGYSQGPLAEDLLPNLPCPAIILWGSKDPWEPLEIGRELANLSTVEQFIPLDGLGHCPQDEAPEIVNPILQKWILAKAKS